MAVQTLLQTFLIHVMACNKFIHFFHNKTVCLIRNKLHISGTDNQHREYYYHYHCSHQNPHSSYSQSIIFWSQLFPTYPMKLNTLVLLTYFQFFYNSEYFQCHGFWKSSFLNLNNIKLQWYSYIVGRTLLTFEWTSLETYAQCQNLGGVSHFTELSLKPQH